MKIAGLNRELKGRLMTMGVWRFLQGRQAALLPNASASPAQDWWGLERLRPFKNYQLTAAAAHLQAPLQFLCGI
jgi:hypothetical protein